MINLINKDRFIYDLEYKSLDIIKEYVDTGQIEIIANNEGLCLEICGFYKFLDYLSDIFNIDKSKITIYTRNSLENHKFYNIKTLHNHWFNRTKKSIPNNYTPTKDIKLKTIACFVGKINWNRLILLTYLNENFKEQSLITCHYRNEDAQKLQSELTELNFYASDELLNCIKFLNQCPLIIDDEFDTYTIGPPEHLTILQHYHKFFAELVIETYVMGNSFFPTEKTIRPIIAKTPFIVMGPTNYLNNLKKLGFKTFDRWWDESYDCVDGVERINQIKKIIETITSWSQERHQEVYYEMKDILEHNRNLYLETDYGKK
jgi:hypothetical protein